MRTVKCGTVHFHTRISKEGQAKVTGNTKINTTKAVKRNQGHFTKVCIRNTDKPSLGVNRNFVIANATSHSL